MSIRRCWFFLLGLPGLLGAFAGAASAQTLTFVDAAGRPASFYLESTRVYVQVEDPAANSPGTVNTVPVTLQADLSGDQEILQLTETGEDTGLFQGFMDLRTGPGLPGDGRLETTADGPPYRFDTVHATYTGGGGGAPAMATAQMLGSLTSFIDSYGNEVTSYAAGQPVRVRVEDHNVDDPGRFDSVAATVQSLGSGDAENLQLQELTKSGGLFEASLPMERNAPAAQNDGRLQASAGEALRAMHTDANGLLASGAQANVDFLTLSFLDESGRPTTEVLESGTARVRVVSAQDNANPFAVDQVQVQLHTQYAGDQEFLTLTETGPDTGVFEGGIPLNLAPVAGNNGTLETQRSGPPDFLPEQITADAGPISATAHTVASRVLFIDGFGRQTSSFPVGGPVGVRVVEPARNFDRQQRETTFIQLQVPGDQETVTLFETGFNTGIFEGTIGSDRGGAQPNDGRLEGQAGQAIFASYQNVTTPNPTLAQALFTGGQVSFVDASGRPTSVYLVGTRARVRVEDHGADVRSWIEDTVVVTVTADLSGDVENLTLTETGPNTGVFEAEVQLREGPAQPGDGVLETREESGPPHEFDTLHASYTTGDGGVSTAQAGTLSFRVWFIDAFGNVVSSYPQGTRTYVRIEDHRFNDPGVFDRIFARVRSASGDLEYVELNETSKTSGIYEGSLPLDSTGTPGQDGRLQARPGDEITAERYQGFTAEPAVARIDFLSLGFIDETGRPTVEVLENGTARVRVVSPQDNGNPGAADSMQVQLRTRYSGDQEFLTLTETGSDTGVFEGGIPLNLAPVAGNNGTLETQRSGPPEFLPEEITATAGPLTATAHTLASRVLFIDGFGRQTSSFPVGGPVGVRVVEPARNFDRQRRETTFIQLQVPGDQETVTLFETGFNTGVFEGTIGSERGGPQPNDNRLQGQAGQTIFASYQNVTTPNPTLAQAVFTGGQVLFVDAAGQPASVYLVGTQARVRVEDHGADARSFAVDTVLSTVSAELSGDFENLTLTETGPNTGVFEAEVQLREGLAQPGDGVLETREESGPPHEFDTLHASYTTGDGGVSTAQAGTLSFRVWFIDAFGNVVSSYPQGTRTYVRIEDHRFNDPGVFDRIFAQVRSASGDLEYVELNETSKTSGIYEGSLPLDSTGTPGQDGRLQARPGDEITAERYQGFTAEPAVARIDFLSLGFIDETGRPTVEVLENGTARVRVVSPQDNGNPGAADSIQVQLRTRYSGDQEFLTLTETGPNTGVFEGGIPLNLAPVAGNNGTLETQRSGPPEFLPEEITATAGPLTATAHTLASRVLFIDGFGRQTSSFPVGGPVGVRVMEPAHNSDPQQRDTAFIQLQVPGDQETVTLFETGFNTGVFEGTIGSERGGPLPNDGRLEGQAGQAIFASYQNVTTPNPTLAQAVFTGGQVLFVDATGQPASIYLVGTQARVRVEDHGADARSFAVDTVLSTVSMELSGDFENLTLIETGPNTGVFEAEVQLREGPAQPGDGVLETREESGPPHEFDTLHASYTTGDGGVSTAQAGTLSFRVWFIDAFGNVVSSYPQGTRTYVRIEDHRFNDPGVFDRIFAQVRSASGDLEYVELNETSKTSGIYEGSLPLDSTGTPGQDGRVQARPGDEITAERYQGFTAEPAVARIDFLSLGFIDETGRPTVEVLENGTARVRVVSPQDNGNPGAADSIQVQLRTRYSGDQEFLTLTETGSDTGVFEGGIPLNLAPVAGNNGTLETQRSGPPEFLPEEITATAGPLTATAHTLASRVLFIDGFGRQTSSFPVGGPVGVRVVEPARNFDPQQRETTFIQLQVPGDQETVTLLETGFNTGIFEGTIGSERGGPQTNDNRLEGQAGQTIFATYQNVTTPNPTLAQAVFTGGQVLFVDNAGQPASVYLVGTRARVRVEDHGADARSFAVDTVLSTVFMELSGDFENLTLTETGPNTGVFEAEVQLREGPALPGDGVLETREEFGPPHEFDTLHASYTTGDGGVSTAQAGTLSFRIWFIDASGQVVTAYTQGPRVYVRIEDHRFNDPGALDRSFARVRSASGDAEVLELTETGLTTGIYEGSLRVDLQGTPGQDGRLQAHPGDQITAERDTGFTAELAVARIDFTTVNSAPVAANDSATVAEDGTVSVAVLANDTDPDGDTLTVTSVTQGAHGAASINPDQTVQYTPAANYNGSDSFTYTISDGNGESATATVNVTVTAVNDAPVANADTATVAEDGTVSVAALANDTDLDGDTLTVASVTQGAHGTVSINPDKTVKYTPAANYNGSDSFTYTVSDGNGGTATATVTVTITAVNDAPVANADTATVAEDGTVSVNVLSNDTDADGDTLTVSSVTQGAHGTVSINPDKTVQYTPVANYNGSDSFTYTISDGNGGTATATVTVAVTAANDAPVANADTATVAEDGNVSVTVLSNDTDADGDTLTVISVTQGAHGTVSINSDQTVKYTPAANYNGSDSFTYTISDGNGGTATATVTVAVTAVNDAPVANADTATVAEDGNVSVTVLSNDTDPDGDTLTVSSVTQGAHGTVSINPDKTVKYTPAANYNGSDSFTYTIADGNGGTATATVTVTVTGVNDAPVANADTATVAEDGTVSVAVLSNDTDLDGDTLTVASVTQGAHDTVSINSDKTVKYTPAANYNGSDSFTYTISDGNGGTATATVTVTITAVNDAPVANADTATVAEDGNVSVTVLANDSDADGDTLTVASVTQGTHGSVSINPDKTVKYTPAANYNGSDSFTYTVSDGNGGTATATVTVTITAVNDSPVANADTATVAEDGTVAVTVLSNDTDPDGDTLTVASVTQGAHGTVSINPDKTVKYTPAANYNGPDAFTYTISDGHGGTATAAVTVSVTTVNDPPVAVNDASATVAGSAVTINVLANDSDIDSPVLMVTSITQGAQGTVVINPDKTVTYTAGLFVGTDSFTYTISDGNGGTATATVTVTVAAPPRVATGIQARYDFNEGSGATVADTSGVGTPLSLTISSTSNVSWVSGGLTVNTATKISNSSQATKIITAAKASNAVTVEAWITPASLSLTGPARILDLSKNSAQRNLVFGQSSNRYETQLKTSTTTASLQSPAASLTLNLTHVVYTRNSSGQAAYYVNGVQVSSQTQSGNLSSWGTDQSLTLSDNWQGTYYLVAVYGRALTTSEVQQNYLAGVN